MYLFLSTEGAAQEKNRLEEKQREVRKLRKKKRDVWEPLYVYTLFSSYVLLEKEQDL